MTSSPASNSGSRWLRWEPHIHAPGTVLNNQFKGNRPWEDYLAALEAAAPAIRALGVTDYYSTDTYEQLLKYKASGRVPGCDLVFPNVEMRLALGTVKGRWVNIHFPVSPEDPDHLGELKRILARLSFEAHDDSFNCSREDLIRLGRKADASRHRAWPLEGRDQSRPGCACRLLRSLCALGRGDGGYSEVRGHDPSPLQGIRYNRHTSRSPIDKRIS